jgi:hypothetical protein
VRPPPFESCISLQELTKKYRKVNPLIKESWDWKVTPEFAVSYKRMEAEGETEGLDMAGMRKRIGDWTAKQPGEKLGFYFCGYRARR